MQIAMKDTGNIMFARNGERDYMVRGEKRPGPRPGAEPPKRRRRRKKLDIPYVFFTLLLLVVLYPVGLIMLWLRKIPWRWTTKLGITFVFAMVAVVVLSVALTTPIDNQYVTGLQVKARQQLASWGTSMSEEWKRAEITPERVGRSMEDMAGYSIQLGQKFATSTLPDIIESVPDIGKNSQDIVASAGDAVKGITRELMYKANLIPTPAPTPTPEPTATPEPTQTPVPTPVPNAYTGSVGTTYHMLSTCPALVGDPVKLPLNVAIEDGMTPCPECGDMEPDGEAGVDVPVGQLKQTSEPAGLEGIGEPEQTSIAVVAKEITEPEVTAEPEVSTAPTVTSPPIDTPAPLAAEPSLNPELASPKPTVTVKPTVKPTDTPAPTDTPTPTETPVPLPAIKPVTEATVYYTSGSKYYHVGEVCGSMKNAKKHTLGEALADSRGLQHCPWCFAPDESIVEAENVVWVGDDEVFHITDECGKLTGRLNLMPIRQAVFENGYKGCEECGASLYVASMRGEAVEETPVPASPIEGQDEG